MWKNNIFATHNNFKKHTNPSIWTTWILLSFSVSRLDRFSVDIFYFYPLKCLRQKFCWQTKKEVTGKFVLKLWGSCNFVVCRRIKEWWLCIGTILIHPTFKILIYMLDWFFVHFTVIFCIFFLNRRNLANIGLTFDLVNVTNKKKQKNSKLKYAQK